MKKLILWIFVSAGVLLVSGCAHKTEVYPTGKNSYTISGVSEFSQVDAYGLAIKGANEYCSKRNKVMQFSSSSSNPGHGFNRYGATVNFHCYSRDSKKYREVVIRKDAGGPQTNIKITNN